MKKLNRLYLGTNTKMYKTIAETTSFLTQLRRLTEDLADSPLTSHRGGHAGRHRHQQHE